MRAKMEAGEVDWRDGMYQTTLMFKDCKIVSSREARRARIRRQYLEKHSIQWDPETMDKQEERVVLKRLDNQRFAAAMEEFSDDDDKPDQEEGNDVDVYKDEEEEKTTI